MECLPRPEVMEHLWKDISGLCSILGFTFILKYRQNGKGGGAGIYVAEKLRRKRRDPEDAKMEGI